MASAFFAMDMALKSDQRDASEKTSISFDCGSQDNHNRVRVL
jgi:hypothetical protein